MLFKNVSSKLIPRTFALLLGLGAAPAIAAVNCYNTGQYASIALVQPYTDEFCSDTTKPSCYNDDSGEGMIRWGFQMCNQVRRVKEACTTHLNEVLAGCPRPYYQTQGGCIRKNYIS
ncbi:hypothetical protein BD779DRAFT_1744389 [Infundibulicybe gibba]|nr:hypothetical protein BD779DRAFT_1744389 [Infundibulicybe gibba]